MKQRLFEYYEQGCDAFGKETVERVVVTEEEILLDYFPYWCERMKDAGKEHMIDTERCIDDFVCVHWATEIKEP